MQQILKHTSEDAKSTLNRESTEPDTSLSPNIIDNNSDIKYSDYLKNTVERRAKINIKNRNSTRALIDLADIHQLKGSHGKAAEYYFTLLNRTNSSVHVLRKLIQALVDKHDVDEARKYYQILMSKSNNRVDIINYLNFVLTYNDPSDIDLDIFEKYRNEYPNDAEINNIYGVCLIKFNRIDDALNVFSRLTNFSPNYIHGFNNLAIVKLAKGQNQKAINLFNKVLNMDKYFLYAYQNLASAYITINKPKNALEVLEEAQSLKLNLEDNWMGNLALLHTDISGDQERASQIHLDLIEKYPSNPFFLNNLGVNYSRLGNLDKAYDLYDKAIFYSKKDHIKDYDPGTYLTFLTNALEVGNKLRKHDETLIFARKILDIQPQNILAINYTVRSLMDDNKLEEARNVSESAYSIDKNNPEIVLNLSYIYSVLDLDNTKALNVLLNLYESDSFPKNINKVLLELFHNNIAYNYLKLGNLESAKKFIDKLSNHYDVLSTKALFNLYAGNLNKAMNIYETAFSKMPESHNRNMNIMFSKYELANYFYINGDFPTSLKYINEGLEFNINKSMRSELRKLKKKIH
jgi:tetratricopeptide (TPR) repeat protein